MITPSDSECEGAYLCKKCTVLRFDDKKFGGYHGISKTGKPELRFDASHTERLFVLDYCHDDDLPDLPGMQSSAQAGCEFCRVLRDAIQALELSIEGKIQVRLEYTWKISQNHREDRSGGDFRNGLYWLIAQIFTRDEAPLTDNGKDEKPSRSIVFLVESASVASWLQLRPGSKQEILCSENISMLKKQINRCVQDRAQSDNSSFLPTRLLDLEAPDTSDGIRLIETETLSLDDCPRYAALSYCWGSELDAKAQLKTEHSSLKDRMASISWTSLPNTTQDAITFTQALSIRYLWIDALCIIQGDLRNWEHESSRMGHIYSHATPTICSLSTSSCRESFLKRIEAISIGFRSTIAPEVNGVFRLRHHPLPQAFKSVNSLYGFRGELSLDYVSRNWAKCAWILQEYQFSNMTVLFGTSRMYFFGAKHSVAEPFEIIINDEESEDVYYEPVEKRNASNMRDKNSTKGYLYDCWLELVVAYAQRRSTLLEDRLPAISGLANLMAQETEDTYIAGIWEGDLLRGVFWEDADRSKHKRLRAHIRATLSSQPYISPSWSWASRRRIIYLPNLYLWKTPKNKAGYLEDHDFRSECANLVATSTIDALDQNPFGRIKSACIRLSGKLATPSSKLARVHRKTRIQQLWTFGFNERYTAFCELDWNCSNMEEMLQSNVKMLLLASTLGLGTERNYPADEDVTERRRRREQGIEGGGEDLSRRNAWGLLIHPTGEPGQYIRVGRFTCRIEQGGHNAFREVEYQDAELI